jgi:uncharacterized protein
MNFSTKVTPNTGEPLPYRGPGIIELRPELHDMKIIGVEEHTTFPTLVKRIPRNSHPAHIMTQLMNSAYPQIRKMEQLADNNKIRIKEMDDGGMSMQILSLSGALNSTHLGIEVSQAGVDLARDINNEMKKAVDAHPTRFCALAELPLHAPDEAVTELRRCVKELSFVGAMMSGSVGGNGIFLDDPQFDTLLSTFEELDVPLFLHPGIPAKPVWDTYYHFPGRPDISGAVGLAGWGWHNDAAVHILRLALSGAFDRHRRLKIVTGHLGEMIPMMMQRFDAMLDERVLGFERSVGEMLRSQVWISISGMYSLAPTQLAIATWGVDRILFANDYPYIDLKGAKDYIRALGDVLSPADLRKICQTNAEALFKIEA